MLNDWDILWYELIFVCFWFCDDLFFYLFWLFKDFDLVNFWNF